MAVDSDVKVANLALNHIGSNPIAALTEDSIPARAVNLVWDAVFEEVLSEEPWSFSLKRWTCSLAGTTNNTNYEYLYQLPSDMVKMIKVVGQDPQDWMIEDDDLATDDENGVILYQYRNFAVAAWPIWFITAFAYRLAAEIAYKVVQSAGIEQAMYQYYDLHLQRARDKERMSTQAIHVEGLSNDELRRYPASDKWEDIY